MEDFCSNNIEKLIISFVSTKSNMGKTTLIESLIKVFKKRGYRVGVLKHDAHKFDIDKEGKDSYRFTHAGADNVIISSQEKLAMIKILQEEIPIDEIVRTFDNVNIIFIEGFKNNMYPKIEVHRAGIDTQLLYKDSRFHISTFIAVATDEILNLDIPSLDLNNIDLIADFIEKYREL